MKYAIHRASFIAKMVMYGRETGITATVMVLTSQSHATMDVRTAVVLVASPILNGPASMVIFGKKIEVIVNRIA